MSEVRIRDNESLESALRRFKRMTARSGILAEARKREHYEKPSVKRAREQAESIRRARKLARKRLQREGLLAAPAKK